MSNTMLHAVLNMPPNLWINGSVIDETQRYSRYRQASKLIQDQADLLNKIKDELIRLDPENNLIKQIDDLTY